MRKTIVDTTYEEFRDIGLILKEKDEPSLQVALDAHARKTLLLSAASFFEVQLSKVVLEFVEEISNKNGMIVYIVRTKIISRQYHTWFDWDKKNVNRFFSLFGPEFLEHMATVLAKGGEFSEGIPAFLEIGQQRNLLVHSDYASYPLEKTVDEVYSLYQKALNFVDGIGAELRACAGK